MNFVFNMKVWDYNGKDVNWGWKKNLEKFGIVSLLFKLNEGIVFLKINFV